MTKIHVHFPDDIDDDDARELAHVVGNTMPKHGDEVTTSNGVRYRVVRVERVIQRGSPTDSPPKISKN